MTQDEIIRMAREAGLWPGVTDVFPKELERFAALVAEATKEKAAKVCEEYAAGGAGSEWDMGYLTAAQSCAAAIRSMK